MSSEERKRKLFTKYLQLIAFNLKYLRKKIYLIILSHSYIPKYQTFITDNSVKFLSD